MAIEVEHKEGVTVVRLQHELTLGLEGEFKDALVELASKNNVNVVLDMTRVDFVDSAGLGMLIWALKNMRQRKGDVRVFGVAKQVMALFDITNMDRVFQMFDSEDDAVASFGEG